MHAHSSVTVMHVGLMRVPLEKAIVPSYKRFGLPIQNNKYPKHRCDFSDSKDGKMPKLQGRSCQTHEGLEVRDLYSEDVQMLLRQSV